MEKLIPGSSQNCEMMSDENGVSSNNETYPKSDFKSGYKTAEQQTPIIRGRKTFAFWTLVVLLFILAVGNLILTVTMVGVLRIGNGIQSIECLPGDNAIKLFGNVDLGRIFKQNGIMKGFEEENMDISADDNSLLINLYSRLNRVFNKFELKKNHTSFNGFNSFEVRNKRKESLFDVSNPIYKNLKGVQTFKAKSLSTNKIRSKLDNDMDIEGNSVYLKGNEGTRIEGENIT
ncbi:hypothetical protein HUJ04_011073 [Dendroctonus ponderosae]|nr:hypothetical protein HUJ04_011073 [Dendroctonus ponderosae]KAH1028305.1 hypothetical protein HUJ05_001673 [Dendroctonus ponderosae]